MRRMLRHTICLAVSLAVPLLAGCGSSGPELGEVTGTVKLGGQPLADAKVIFHPEGGGSPSIATTDASGHYELMFTADKEGAMIGKHKVTVSTFRQQSNPDGSTTTIPERVPAQYTSPSTTILTKEVTAGGSEINIDL